jgi:hypothetical protein
MVIDGWIWSRKIIRQQSIQNEGKFGIRETVLGSQDQIVEEGGSRVEDSLDFGVRKPRVAKRKLISKKQQFIKQK